MGYITNSAQVISLLVANVFQVFAITTRFDNDLSSIRNFRRHIGSTLTFPDWELGLREAVYQALLRERNLHQHLREYLLSAPIIGRQNTATPFGDIAIVARGQLYSAPGGFQFVQDPYQNDCDGCHNPPPRCDDISCENWKPEGHERLLALWTVKRIRHRDSNYGYRYELQYKVTPMNVAANEHFVTRKGRFDYSVPGHTFIVKAGPQHSQHTFERINSISDKVYRSPHNHWSPNNYGPNFDSHYLPPPPPLPPAEEQYYDNDPRNAGYPNVLYGPPELYTRRPPYSHYTTRNYQQPYDSPEDEADLFNTFFKPTTKKTPASTSTTTQSSVFDLFTNTQTSPPLFTPIMTTKTSVSSSKPTSPTVTESISRTTPRDTSHIPSIPIPILPTIPIVPTSSDRTTKSVENTTPTKPLFSPSTIRFPTIPSSKSTTITSTTRFSTIPSSRSTTPSTTTRITRFPTILSSKSTTSTTPRFSEPVTFVKYSEPDPLFGPTTASTQMHSTSTTKYKTTESDDYDIFGPPNDKMKGPKQIKFPGDVNVKLPPGEHVITVVDAPTLIPKQNIIPVTESTESVMLTQRYQPNFNNTQLLNPINQSYITITVNPSTRGQFSSSSRPTTQATTKTGVFTELIPSQEAAESFSDLTTTQYTTRNYVTSERATTTPFAKTTSRATRPTFRTRPFTRPSLFKTTTPSITEITSAATSETSFRTPPLSTSITLNHYSPRTRPTLSPYTTSSLRTVTMTPKRRTSPASFSPITRKMYSTLKPLPPRTKPTQGKAKTQTFVNKETTYILPTVSYVPKTSTRVSMTSLTTTSVLPTDFETTNPTTMGVLDTTIYENTVGTTANIFSSTSPEITETNLPVISTESMTLSNVTSTTSKLDSTKYTTPEQVSSTVIVTTAMPISTIITTDSEIYTTGFMTQKNNQSLTISNTTPAIEMVTRPISSTKPSTTDSFLSGNGIPSKKTNIKDDESFEFEIFGTPQEKNTKESTPKIQDNQGVQRFNSKEIDDIFDELENSKLSQKHSERINARTTNTESPISTTTLKVIFSNFYSPSTASNREKTNVSFKNNNRNDLEIATVDLFDNSPQNINNETTESEPLTRQSYSTSVSFEVNKKNKITTENNFPDTSHESEELENVPIENSLKKTKYVRPVVQIPCNNVTGYSLENEDKKILDDLTLSVVNHAKSIDILNSNNDTDVNNAKEKNHTSNNDNNKERKYKRKRIYKALKSHRPV